MITKTANLLKERQVIKLCFPNDKRILHEIVKIPNFQMKNEHWEIPVSEKIIEKLIDLGFELSPSLKNWGREEIIIRKEKLDLPPELYPYQIDGVHFLNQEKDGLLLADEMGLGKTVQVLCWLKLHPEYKKVLIICPSSLKVNWQRELKRWTGYTSEIVSGTTAYPLSKNIIIINYDILPYWEGTIRYNKFNLCIFDEAHFIKNNAAKRTKCFKKIMKTIPKSIALTGTPIENKPIEIYNIVTILNPNIFPNYMTFITEFCGARKNRFGWDVSGATNTERLNNILTKTIMLRRKKDDVLKELPPKQIVKVPMQISNLAVYKKAEEEFIQFIADKFSSNSDEIKEELKNFAKRYKIDISDELTETEIAKLKAEKLEKISLAPVFSQIEILKQLSANGKIDQIIDWIENFLESGEKLVVFAVHKKIIEKIVSSFKDIAVKVDGTVTPKQRQEAVDGFQNNPKIKLFVGNIRAAGVGITLTKSSNVAIVEFPWTPAALNQASDRVHRITQTKQVTIWNLIGEDTIEERIIDLLKKKEKIISKVIDGQEYDDSSVIMDLIESYKMGGKNNGKEKN